MSKHTPGPWNKEKIRYILRHVSKQGIFFGFDDDDDWEDKSPNIPDYYNDDYKLIAAAPEMLAALNQIFLLTNYSTYKPFDQLVKINKIAKAAIKKAEGDK